MFNILKLKRAKNSYEGNPTDLFSRDRQKFQATPQPSQKYTRIYHRKQNEIK
jgi:hypothetical protein